MLIIEWWAKNGKKPFGIVGLDDKGKLFVNGLDEEYYLDDLETNILDEDDNQLTEKDGVKFLEAVRDRYTRNISQGELSINGPFEVKTLPEVDTHGLKPVAL